MKKRLQHCKIWDHMQPLNTQYNELPIYNPGYISIEDAKKLEEKQKNDLENETQKTPVRKISSNKGIHEKEIKS